MLATMKKFFRRINSQVMNLIKEDGFFFVVLTILNAPIIFFPKDFQEGAMNFWFGILALFMLAAAIHLLPLKIRRLLQTTLITLFALLFVANIFLLQKFSVPLNPDTLQILLGTNFIEAKEFLQEYFVNFKVLGSLAAFIFLLAALSLGLKKFFATRSEERLKRLSTELLIILLLPFLPVLINLSDTENFLPTFTDNWFSNTIPWLAAKDTYELVRTAPIGSEEKIFAEMEKQLETEKILADDSNIPFVIFVLGEATDRISTNIFPRAVMKNFSLNRKTKSPGKDKSTACSCPCSTNFLP
ncbi:MAG: hypothetical protein II902_09300, partial [Selenomonadaceae bacterium]|nr:hypothetical protein [Selenomonadaceae bacterium]